MAKAVLIAFRDPAEAQAMAGRVNDCFARIAARLADPECATPPACARAGATFTACLSPAESVRRHQASIGLGWIEPGATPEAWARPGAPVGDGSFALFRVGETAVELVSDALGTRTLWYHHDGARLIAATSQRALVLLLGSFEPNRAVVPWMLANGNAGPAGSWDRRLSLLPPGHRLHLDRAGWQVTMAPAIAADAPVHAPGARDDAGHRRAFAAALEETADRLSIDPGQWLLPLSGGYDSRLLACLLAGRLPIPTITWGLGRQADNPEAEVAARLAAALALPHRFVALGGAASPVASLLERFVAMSEGTTDSVAAYLDGFALWRTLAASGVAGIVRGDEPFGGFGWSPVHSERAVRAGLGLARLDERGGTAWLAAFDGMAQPLPEPLQRRAGEPLESWRHRLYCAVRVPVALAALTETKTGYVDVINPLQSRRVVDVVRALPDRLRTDKRLLIERTNQLTPAIPYASIREGDVLSAFLREPATVAFLREALSTQAARAVLPEAALARLSAQLPSAGAATTDAPAGRLRAIDRLKAALPHWVKRRLRRFAGDGPMDPCLLAFRAWIVIETHRLFAEDAALGGLGASPLPAPLEAAE